MGKATMKLTKAHLIEQVENLPFNLSKNSAKAVVDAILGGIREQVAAGNTVALRGFGTFAPRQWPERLGRNPRTGEAIKLPAMTTMHFKASKPGAED